MDYSNCTHVACSRSSVGKVKTLYEPKAECNCSLSTHNTTEEWEKKIKELNNQWNESVPKSMMLELSVYVHNLALQQVLEKFGIPNIESLEVKREFWEDEDHAVGGYISRKDIKSIITSLQKE